jgi:hypothetical protein
MIEFKNIDEYIANFPVPKYCEGIIEPAICKYENIVTSAQDV